MIPSATPGFAAVYHNAGACQGSEADYGQDAEAHFAALQTIRATGQVPAPMEWIPGEVLELIRWSEPEAPEWKPGGKGRRGHWMRAFCCVALLTESVSPESVFYGENQTIAQLVSSILALDRDLAEPALHFLSWFALQKPYDHEEHPFFLFAVLLLAVYLARFRDNHLALEGLIDHIVAAEARQEAAECHHKPDDGFDGWLLRLSFYNMRHETWQRLADSVLVKGPPVYTEALSLRLRSMGESIVAQKRRERKP